MVMKLDHVRNFSASTDKLGQGRGLTCAYRWQNTAIVERLEA